MATKVCVQLQVVTFACMNFAFGECDENEVDVILTCVVHRDNEHNFITFILDLMTKMKKLIVKVTLIHHHHIPVPLVTVLGSAIFSLKINSLSVKSTSH